MVKRGYSKFISLIHFLGDVLLMNLCFIFAYFLYNKINSLFSFSDHYIFLQIAFNLLWVILALRMQAYRISRTVKIRKILIGLIQMIVLHALLVFASLAFIKSYYFSRGHLFVTYGSLVLILVTWRTIVLYFLKVYRKSGSNYRNVVIIGAGPAALRMYKYLISDPSLGFRVLGFFDDEKEPEKNKMLLGKIGDLEKFIKIERIDEMFYAQPLDDFVQVNNLMKFADNHLIRFNIIPELRGVANKRIKIDFYNNIPVLTVRAEPMDNIFNLYLKRVFDILFSICAFLFIFPLIFPAVVIAIKVTSKGPVFFKQKRTGRNNKEFYCFKFRTMYVNNEADTLQASVNDSRVTNVGYYLRKFSIDELPQFYNVLIGDMTIVGPRPHMLKHTDDYSKVVDQYMVRHFVKPGITGLAQIKGLRGETQNANVMGRRVRHDLWYMENWSFLLDIKIIFLTVFSIFKGNKNAF